MVVVQVGESPQKAPTKIRFRNYRKICSDSIPFIEYTLAKTNSKSPWLLSIILKIYFLLGPGLKWQTELSRRRNAVRLLEVGRRGLAPSEAFWKKMRHEHGMVIWCFQGVYVEYAGMTRTMDLTFWMLLEWYSFSVTIYVAPSASLFCRILKHETLGFPFFRITRLDPPRLNTWRCHKVVRP